MQDAGTEVVMMGTVMIDPQDVLKAITSWHRQRAIEIQTGQDTTREMELQKDLYLALRKHPMIKELIVSLEKDPKMADSVLMEMIMMGLEIGVRVGGQARVVVMAEGRGKIS